MLCARDAHKDICKEQRYKDGQKVIGGAAPLLGGERDNGISVIVMTNQ
jgi:hypothetical protein